MTTITAMTTRQANKLAIQEFVRTTAAKALKELESLNHKVDVILESGNQEGCADDVMSAHGECEKTGEPFWRLDFIDWYYQEQATRGYSSPAERKLAQKMIETFYAKLYEVLDLAGWDLETWQASGGFNIRRYNTTYRPLTYEFFVEGLTELAA